MHARSCQVKHPWLIQIFSECFYLFLHLPAFPPRSKVLKTSLNIRNDNINKRKKSLLEMHFQYRIFFIIDFQKIRAKRARKQKIKLEWHCLHFLVVAMSRNSTLMKQ